MECLEFLGKGQHRKCNTIIPFKSTSKKRTVIRKKEKANSWLPRGLGKGENGGDSLTDTGSPCR